MDDPDGYFGESVAATYDKSTDGEFDPAVIAETTEVLAGLAAPGRRALEFAIGTGRVAVPLSERGVSVHGIDLSRAMVARLHDKNPEIRVEIGDFSSVRVEERNFDLVYLVFNTVMNLTTQDAQVRCFRNAAAQLRPGGRFLIEVMVPELRKLPAGQTLVPFTVTPTRWGFDRYDVATQAMSSNYLTLHDDGQGDFLVGPVPLSVAGRDGPDGPHRRPGAGTSLGFVVAHPVHPREQQDHRHLGQALGRSDMGSHGVLTVGCLHTTIIDLFAARS